jgi:hypothetical protein
MLHLNRETVCLLGLIIAVEGDKKGTFRAANWYWKLTLGVIPKTTSCMTRITSHQG